MELEGQIHLTYYRQSTRFRVQGLEFSSSDGCAQHLDIFNVNTPQASHPKFLVYPRVQGLK